MAECGDEAVLVVTQTVEGTTTNVVRRRIELRCGLPAGHSGAHSDAQHGEEWQPRQGHKPVILRHEDEPKDGQ